MLNDSGGVQAGEGRGLQGRPGLFLRSLAFAIGMALATLLLAPVSLLTIVLPFRHRYAFISQWARFNLWWLGKTCRLHARVEGLENVPTAAGVVLCKHQSAWETLALQRIFRPQAWVLKRELLRIPFFGWGLAMLKPIAIDRGTPRKALSQVGEQGRQRLEAGIWVVIFPEGTRVAPGERKPYQVGGAFLAKRAGRRVVPVAHNAGDFWPRHAFIKRPGTIRLVIGPSIDSAERSAAEINRLAEEWIEGTVAAIRAEAAGTKTADGSAPAAH